ncbi:protein kinase family protein [Streptomyces sp. NBC_01775]|uniref:protein kinase family protein n=1 Tax=Streptomyces sp. NBC_01775 TaxID=2975939 RepID=UPI002DDA9613|nr:protein kinase family protein [Streptomyces sp. NBC_01775]WSB78016.1 protein kinase family protein [Streptomyces sp. NBC_01775]
MAERSTAAVDVAETGGENGDPLNARQDGATSDGATDATNGHSRDAEASQEAPADPTDIDDAADPTGPADEAADSSDEAASLDEGQPEKPNAEAKEEATVKTEADADVNATAGSEKTDRAEKTTKTGKTEKPAKNGQKQAKPQAKTQEAAPGSEPATGIKTPAAGTKAEAAASEQTATSEEESPAQEAPEEEPPELHSGHKLARRYRLEECVTRLDGFSSWRAVDEKLRRAVGVHALPVGHPRARQVLAAARSAALLGDPRFVQVLDAVEEGDLVYVVHEWLPDATPLNELLAAGPLEPHEAYQLVSQLAQALTAAHREGLAHLRLTPACVLRTGMGQYRIRGLAVNAALRGVSSDHPQRDDTEAIGALLYASLTQRWPYEEDAHGLPGVGTLAKGALVAPEQVRAGVHRGLSTLAMRALVNDGATPSRQEQPCATPEELSKAVSTLPRIRPPEPSFTPPPPYQRTAYQQGAFSAPGAAGNGGVPGGTAAGAGAEPPAPPTLPGRTGKILKWGVSALLIAALGLGSWQVADALLKGEPTTKDKAKPAQRHDTSQAGKVIKIDDVKDFDPETDGSENPDRTGDAVDGKSGTYWLTKHYIGRPDFGNLKSGVGLILDLGKTREVSQLKVDFMGKTSASFLAAPRSVTNTPSALNSFSKVTSGSGEHLRLKAKKPIKTRFVLLWLTKLPLSEDGNYRGRVTEVQVLS